MVAALADMHMGVLWRTGLWPMPLADADAFTAPPLVPCEPVPACPRRSLGLWLLKQDVVCVPLTASSWGLYWRIRASAARWLIHPCLSI